jgi:hypothetical protein
MNPNETFKVVYNASHGGFGLNERAFAEYNRRASKNVKFNDSIDRMDTVLIDMVETMGNTINETFSKLKVKEFPIKYKSFLWWHEYDGNETVKVDYDKYLIHHIKLIKDNNNITAEEKMKLIQELYDEYDMRPK